LGLWQEAADVAEKGIRYWPTMPELPWYIGFCLMRQGKYEEALPWARKAIAIQEAPQAQRFLFKLTHAHKRGPYEVLNVCLRKSQDFLALGQSIGKMMDKHP
jgi:tetratricopeptide (TPR) repeat protein